MRGRVQQAAAASIVAAAMLTVPAQAEVSQRDGVRVSLNASISPKRLPRTGPAPVAISLAGRIAAATKGAQPKLARLSIAINSHGKLQTEGIPVCRIGRIDPSTSAEALAACRSSLIGEGSFSADVKIPEQSPFPSRGKLLAFNGKLGGKPALLAHIYGTDPAPTSYVLPFVLSSTHGTYGTVLEASLPQVTGEWGYVTGISLDLQHRYLAASCPAPRGFPGVSFPLIKAGFAFAGGPTLTSTLTRSCEVRQ